MGTLRIYEINPDYIDYLNSFIPHLFRNKKPNQQNERKYIGIVLEVHNQNYFAPLSSFKTKHKFMPEGLDLIKIKHLAVINLNNMFPAPQSQIVNFDIKTVLDQKYKALLQREYRAITSMEQKICENAEKLYQYKIKNGDFTPLAKRCNDFLLLEQKALEYTTEIGRS
ncbi:type III toxin-antitoxin system ToxN/AbiQ family toxin [bacterium]|nr:type III toxin-antitoxin system ToxN/AbiQ family toxin [bacterium]